MLLLRRSVVRGRARQARRRNAAPLLLAVPLALHSPPLCAETVRFSPEPTDVLQAAAGWSMESDGILLLAGRDEMDELPDLGPATELSRREITARLRRIARQRRRIVVAESRPEIALLATGLAQRLGAALFFDGADEQALALGRSLWLLGEVELPHGAGRKLARVEHLPTVSAVESAYDRLAAGSRDVVLVDPEDPYAPIGALVAQHYGAALATNLEKARQRNPRSLIACLSPRRFDDRFLLALSSSLRPVDGIGILTGVDRLACQRLWHRGLRFRKLAGALPERVTVARAANRAAHWPAEIRTTPRAGDARHGPLTAEALRAALARSAYVSFSGHGSPAYLRLRRGPDGLLPAGDVPPRVAPLVFVAASCQTFRFWEAPERSIALALGRAGAAAFVGFAYSPIEGFLPGQVDGAPVLASHPGFPLGRVVRLLNDATERRFARVPFLFLLGDPHLAALPDGPRLQALSRSAGGTTELLLRGGDRVSGWAAFTVPARRRATGSLAILRGEETLARVPLAGKVFHKDLIAAPRAGAVDVLARVPAGDLTVRIEDVERHPEAWLRAGVASADYALPFMTASHGYGAYLVLAAAWLAAVLIATRGRARRELGARMPWLLGSALLFAAAYAAYCVARWPHLAVTTKGLEFDPVSALVPAAAGFTALLTRLSVAHRRRAVLLGALAAGFPWLGAGAVMAAASLGGNLVVAAEVGRPIWSLGTATPLLAAGLGVSLLAGISHSFLLFLEREVVPPERQSAHGLRATRVPPQKTRPLLKEVSHERKASL